MKISEISAAQLSLAETPSSEKASSNTSTSLEYSKILADKIASARDEMKRMDEIQAQLDEIADLHEELTGHRPDSSDSSETSTIKKFLPDGSILFLTIEGNQVVQSFKKRPHMVAVADPSAPLTESGQTAVKLVAKPQLDLAALLM